MENIGVILPHAGECGGFFKRLFDSFKYEKITVTEYGFNFVAVHHNRNYARVFKKNKVKNIVLLTDCVTEKYDFEILNGDKVYKRMIPGYVRKLSKSFADGCSVTVVDKSLCADTADIVDKLCDICKNVSLVTHSKHEGEKLACRLFEKYGVVVDIPAPEWVICSDIAVVIEDCGNSYSHECTVIDKSLKTASERRINDFYIPFRVKPPFGMSNLEFAQCLDAIDKKNVDIR